MFRNKSRSIKTISIPYRHYYQQQLIQINNHYRNNLQIFQKASQRPTLLYRMSSKQQTLARFFGGGASSATKTNVKKQSDTINDKENETNEKKMVIRGEEIQEAATKSEEAVVEKDEDSVDLKRPRSNSLLTNGTNGNKKRAVIHDDEEDGEETEDFKMEPTAIKKLQPQLDKAIEPMKYSELCNVFQKLENEPGRLKNLAIAAEFFLKVLIDNTENAELQKKNMIEITYLMINRLGPDYEPGLELGLGETILIKALSAGTGRSTSMIKKEYQEVGDIGVVAQKSRSKQTLMFKPKQLTLNEVFNNLQSIAKSTGANSQTKKINIINKMLTSCQGEEAKFLMRSLEGKLRINFGEKSVLTALSKAFIEYDYYLKGKKTVPAEIYLKAEEEIKESFSQVPNYEIIIENMINYGVLNIVEHCGLKPGIPLKPMLAKPTKSISEILDQFTNKEFTCEYKYDGERAQLHLLPNGELFIYSRNSENMTERYPELVNVINELKRVNGGKIQSMILDCECVAWDVKEQKILPFQVLSTRKRKDVKEEDIKVQVCLFAFDLLYFNNESLIRSSLKHRRSVMFDNLKCIDGKFEYAKQMNSSNLDDISKFLDQSVRDSCEGLMIKSLNNSESYYEPSKRSRNWLKLKKDYLEGIGDSLDLVVIGGYIGKGKRTGVYGGFLLGSYNDMTDEIESICKIGTGFSEELLKSLSLRLKETEIPTPLNNIIYNKDNIASRPDIWFRPTLLFEVKAADFTESPIYKSGCTNFGDGSKGISLRFPRFIRLREDKNVEDGTSSEQVVEMYRNQAGGR